jgi:hypothetical protein
MYSNICNRCYFTVMRKEHVRGKHELKGKDEARDNALPSSQETVPS